MDESGARRIYARIFLGLLALSVALLAVVVLRPFLSAIAWAIVLAVGGRAPWRWLEQRLAPHRSLAASLMCVGIALVVILPAALVGSVLVDQATHAVTLVRDVLSRQQVSSVADVLALPWVTAARRWVEAWLGITPQWLLDRAGEAAAGLSTFVAAKGGGVVLGFVEALVTFVLTIFLLFFASATVRPSSPPSRTSSPSRPTSGSGSSAPSAPCSRPFFGVRSCVASSRERREASAGDWPGSPRLCWPAASWP